MGWLGENCQLCGMHRLRTLLDMGVQPLAERFDAAGTYPLVLRECMSCHLVQLGYQVDAATLFPEGHPYASGNTQVLRDHYADLARELAGRLRGGDLVVEVGANDGTLLGAFPGNLRLVAVEPTGQADKCRPGIVRYRNFFTCQVAREIARQEGRARLVLANNVLAHVPDPLGALHGIALMLAEDGLFVSENHDVSGVLRGQIDTVYHEHLRYWSPATFAGALEQAGLEVTEIRQVPTHGGSFRTYARRRLNRLALQPARAKRLQALLRECAASGEVYGVGATTRAVPLIHYAGIAGYITAVAEVTGSEKIGRCMPGTGIPVVDEKLMFEKQPAWALLLSWHLAEFLVPKLRAAGYKGKFIIPLPEPKVVE